MSWTMSATNGRSVQWYDCPKVTSRNVPRSSAGMSSARPHTHCPDGPDSRAASASIAGSGSRPTTDANRSANIRASTPGPQPTSSIRPVPSRPSRSTRAGTNRSEYGGRARA